MITVTRICLFGILLIYCQYIYAYRGIVAQKYQKLWRPKGPIDIGCYANPHKGVYTDMINNKLSAVACEVGTIMFSSSDLVDNLLCHSVILVCKHDLEGSEGFIINKHSDFTMGEIAANMGVFSSNSMFTGGNVGASTAVMIHKYDLGGNAKHIGKGYFIGGFKEAKRLVDTFNAHPRDFRFIMDSIRLDPRILDDEISCKKWIVCDVPPDVTLDASCSNAHETLWERLNSAQTIPPHN